MTRSYKIYTGTLTSGDNKALIRIIKKGVITAVNFIICGLAGAAVDNSGELEVSLQSVSSFTVNDTPATVITYGTWAAPISSGAFCVNSLVAGLSNPVNQGDQIYLHCLGFNTALSAGRAQVIITVNE